jgi:hypothetical protein
MEVDQLRPRRLDDDPHHRVVEGPGLGLPLGPGCRSAKVVSTTNKSLRPCASTRPAGHPDDFAPPVLCGTDALGAHPVRPGAGIFAIAADRDDVRVATCRVAVRWVPRSNVQHGQVELVEVLEVGDHVDLDDLPACDREAEYCEQPSAWSDDDSNGAVHECRLCGPGTPP